MAAIAIPLLELAAEGIAAAWTSFVASGAATATAGGVATAGVIIGIDQATKDKTEAQTKAQTDAATRTRTRNCKCPPDSGAMAPVNHSMSDLSARYQQYVTGFPRGMEWKYCAKDFDGFQSPQCLLQEAKAKYDQFFDEETGEPKWFFTWSEKKGFPKMRNQAKEQSDIVMENPPAKLKWYFMQPISWRYATREFARRGFLLTTELKPMI
jgi:hypothetical protein